MTREKLVHLTRRMSKEPLTDGEVDYLVDRFIERHAWAYAGWEEARAAYESFVVDSAAQLVRAAKAHGC